MKKALLAGIVGLVIGGGIAVPSIANATTYGYNGSSCQGAPAATVAGGTIHGPNVQSGGDQVACANGFGGTTAGAVDGGAISAGVNSGSSQGRLCAAGLEEDNPVNTGAYAVIDGDDSNTANLRGYGALSNNEEGGTEDCAQGNNGSNTNSGGSFGVDGVATAPVPLIACGFTSGPDYGSTGRDGCYIP